MAKLEKLQQLQQFGIGTFKTQVKYRNGYIINAFENNKAIDALVMPVSCFNGVGVGILKAVCERYPMLKSALDQTSCGDQKKLGKIVEVEIVEGKSVVFVFTSIGYNKNTMPKNLWNKPGVNLRALKEGMLKVLEKHNNVCLPTFGKGMFPTQWETIEGVLDDIISLKQNEGSGVTITVFK
tara:strand:- start:1694 stop:2236 length:543 start_codon:yes stop_codon:yes gene_type:complete